ENEDGGGRAERPQVAVTNPPASNRGRGTGSGSAQPAVVSPQGTFRGGDDGTAHADNDDRRGDADERPAQAPAPPAIVARDDRGGRDGDRNAGGDDQRQPQPQLQTQPQPQLAVAPPSGRQQADQSSGRGSGQVPPS